MPDQIYVVAGAVRIQPWIARTPLLRLSRGASRALATETGAQRIDAFLERASIPAVRAEDAPDIDGVVALRIDNDQDYDDDSDSDAAAVEAVVAGLRARLAQTLPGIEWQVWAHRAPTYVAAYQHVMHGRRASHGRWHLPSAETDFPLATSCDGCNVEVATGTAVVADETLRLGADCRARLNHTAGESDQRAWTFETLARRGGVGAKGARASQVIGRRGADNHLATISADGNRVGAFFERLSTLPAEPFVMDGRQTTVQEGLSRRLAEATCRAVVTAGRCGDPDAKLLCAIDHLIGGDDVLVSVAARFAWNYVRTLIGCFSAEFVEAVRAVVASARREKALTDDGANELTEIAAGVSLGVGMIFANRTHPFAHTAELAHDALAEAKRAGRGEAAVGWLDITVDPPTDGVRTALGRDLSDEAAPAVFAFNASARATLGGLIRDARRHASRQQQQQPSDDPPGEPSPVASVRAWCDRTGRPELLTEWAGPTDLRRLENDLDRARWWPDLADDPEEDR